MKRLFLFFILFSLVIILFSIAINAEKAETETPKASQSSLEFSLSCDECHPNAEKYPPHLEGYSYCEDCHGGDVHPIHPFNCKTCHEEEPLTPFCHGAPPDTIVPTANGLVCKACHESNLVTLHPDCQLCHQNINEIHKEADVAGGVSDV